MFLTCICLARRTRTLNNGLSPEELEALKQQADQL